MHYLSVALSFGKVQSAEAICTKLFDDEIIELETVADVWYL